MSISPLLALPKELRLLIFDHLFADHGPVLVGYPSPLPWEGKARRYHPAVAEACRQLREEALPIFYKTAGRVILLLRYHEGRCQVQRWIDTSLVQDRIRKHVQEIFIRYVEESHMATSILLDQNLRILNRESWVHPVTLRSLKMLSDADSIISEYTECSKSALGEISSDKAAELLRRLFEAMLVPLKSSRLLRCERMSNIRLHGYSSFQLRFEVITIIYNESGQ